MPRRNGKLSRDKIKSDVIGLTLVNFTELLIYFDGMSVYRLREIIARDPFFPKKATRMQWTLASIRQWEEREDRVQWWEDNGGKGEAVAVEIQ